MRDYNTTQTISKDHYLLFCTSSVYTNLMKKPTETPMKHN